jgi:hypothetical protein
MAKAQISPPKEGGQTKNHPIRSVHQTAYPTLVQKDEEFRLVLIRMFRVFVGAIIDRPQTTAKKTGDQWSPLQTDFGRDVVFSADLCYNDITP